VKEFYLICVKIYCEKGQPGVCDFAENVAEICEEKFYITIDGELDECGKST
jgi:hypothetical protein